MKKPLLGLLLLFSLFLMISCTEQTTETNKPIIAVSIVPQAAIVEAIAEDKVDVITLIPPGYSPGNYEPSAKTMEEMSHASVYFTIGVPTESGNILPDIEDIEVVHLETLVAEIYPDLTFSGGGRDPHIWLSINRIKVMVEIITDKLAVIDPENASLYQINANVFIAELNETQDQIEEIFSDITMNKFIVFHPSFGYFADEYGLDMISLEEDGKEATAAHLQEVIDLAELYEIGYVFHQAEIDSTQVQSFAEEIEAVVVTLYPLSEDFCANMVSMAEAIREAMR